MLSWLPENASTFGGEIDSIFALIHYVVGVWFLATQAYLVYCLIRFRRREGQTSEYHPGTTSRQMAWVLIPCAVVLVLDLWIDFRGADAWAKAKLSRPIPQVVVRLTATQFNWRFTYPGPDGRFGTKDDKNFQNDLYVPVNKVVRIILTGKDVIHSFFVPVDLIPFALLVF